ncbi:otolin-1 [Eleginops maclovinus]
MLRHADRAMLMGLLGLLLLPPLCSAMILSNGTNNGPGPYVAEFRIGPRMGPEDMNRTEGDFGVPDPSMNFLHNTTFMPEGAMFSPPMPDPALCSMLMNMPIPPVDQIPLSCLCSLCKGTAGPKGDRGDRGLPGAPGSAGMRGMTGFTGPRGFTGVQGMKGQKGDQGEKGQVGDVGFTGVKGSRGYKGEKGDFGSEGPPGSPGSKGESGICPASCESVQGPPGLQGSPGPAGARGLPGVQGPMGQKGMKGPKGDLGTPGNHGVDGQKGDQGAQGMCNCTDGENGTNGLPGAQGFKGDKGDLGAQGEKGSMGLKGNKGDLGVRGVPGPCSSPIRSAFSAALDSSYPAPNWPIPFTRVIFNLYGHFNPMMGMFTAPVNGTYIFSFSLAVSGKPVVVGVYKNFERMAIATEVNNLSSATQTVIMHLFMGNKVWLQVKDANFNGVMSGEDNMSTFSGHLLYPDSCEMPIIGREGAFPIPDEYSEGDFIWKNSTQTTTTPEP